MALPALLKALSSNADTNDGAESLAGALDQHRGDQVDDIKEYLRNVDAEDGAKILNHILGNKNQSVQNKLAKQSGLEKSQVSGLLSQIAPLLLGSLGQQKEKEKLDASGIAGLLSQLTGSGGQSAGNGIMGLVGNLLDTDNDGDIVDNLGGIFGSLFKAKKPAAAKKPATSKKPATTGKPAAAKKPAKKTATNKKIVPAKKKKN